MGTQLPAKGEQPPPQFSANVSCGQTAGWIKMPPATEISLGPGDIVLDGDPAPLERKGTQQPPTFRLKSIVAKRSHVSARAELLYACVR